MAANITAMLDHAPSRRKGRRIGVAVRPGSVKEARLEAGLTLAQLGGTQLTRAAVHLIENCKAKPSLESLQLISRRTGKPLEHFLVDPNAAAAAIRVQDQLKQLDLLNSQRRSDEAVALARHVLAAAADQDVAAAARLHLGQALYRLLRPEEALDALRPARQRFEAAGDQELMVAAMLWEAAARSLIDDPGALPLAQQALEIGERLKPPPVRTLAAIHARLASMHRARQEWTQALRSFDRALEMAGSIRDLQLLARLYDDMSETYQHLGRPAKALELIRRAIRLYSMESDEGGRCRAENNHGDILMQQGRLDEAEPHFLRALEGTERLGLDRRGRAHVLANLGDLHWRRGDLDRAAEFLGRAREVAAALNERIVVARADALLGEIAEAQGQPAEADRLFAASLEQFADLDIPDRLRRIHMAYAEVLERRQDFKAASSHWRAAAEIAEPRPRVLIDEAEERAG